MILPDAWYATRMRTPDERVSSEAAFAKQIEAALLEQKSSEPLLSAVENFGGIMVNEVVGRTTTIEAKAVSVLGWTTALLAFLLFDRAENQSVFATDGRLLLLTLVAVLWALAASAYAAGARRWRWPSARDWFCTDYFDDPSKLRVYHQIALLETCQAHHRINEAKGRALTHAQWALLLAALVTGWRLAVRAFG